MKVSELHPEEALDLYERGRLGARELEALKAHLARCPSCAAHVQWRADVQASLAETGADAAEGRRLAGAVLARLGIPAPVQAEVRPAGSRRRWTMVAAMIAISLVAGAASAKFWPSIERMWQRPSAPALPAPAPSRPPRQMARQLPSAPPQTPEQTPPAARPAPPQAPRPRASSRPAAIAGPPHRRPAPDALAGAGAPAPSLSGPSGPPEAAPPLSPPSATRLFAEVARARRAGWLTEAHQAYGELSARFAGSREERAASVLLGQLTLEQGQLGDALARFDAYLRAAPNGALAEEARLGRALAIEQLGHPADARRAWQELLDRHPRSVHAGRARARLESLPSPGHKAPPR